MTFPNAVIEVTFFTLPPAQWNFFIPLISRAILSLFPLLGFFPPCLTLYKLNIAPPRLDPPFALPIDYVLDWYPVWKDFTYRPFIILCYGHYVFPYS